MASDLSELVASADLPALVEAHAGHGRHSGGRYVFSCPHPDHPDRNPSFSVWQTPSGKWIARCHSQCNWTGDALDFMQWIHGGAKGDAARRLRAWMGRPDTFTPQKRAAAPKPQAKPTLTVVDPCTPDNGPEAQKLMAKYETYRGWPPGTAELFGLSVVVDQWGRRSIRHPFHTWNRTTCRWEATDWQNRTTGKDRRKWISPKGAPLPLFHLKSLDTQPAPVWVVVCEGPADAITAAVALRDGPPVAVLGVPGAGNWRPGWARHLGDLPVVVAADPDPSGRKLAGAVVNDLGRAAHLVVLADGDLCDTAKARGLDAVRTLLMAPMAEAVKSAGVVTDRVHQPEPAPTTSDAPPRAPVWVQYADLAAVGPHGWLWCDTCREAALTRPGTRCRMTYQCQGHMVPIRDREGVLAS